MADDKGEIEIIPPGEDDGATSRIWIATGEGNVKVIKLGPFGALALGLAVLLLLALGFFFLSGLFLVLVPVALLLVGGAYLSGLVGAAFKRLK